MTLRLSILPSTLKVVKWFFRFEVGSRMNNGLPTDDVEQNKRFRARSQKWLENRLKVVDTILALSNGIDTETSFDAQIILFCTLSAIAAANWPGDRIDQVRFIELLASYCTISPSPRTISIGALMNSYEGTPEGAVIQNALWKFEPNRVVQALEVDVDETVVLRNVPSLTLAAIRQSSYAHIIYRDLRSALVHQYALKERVTDWSFLNKKSLHYSNVNEKPRLFLPFDYLRNVVQATAEATFDKWQLSANYGEEEAQPPSWWIRG